MTRAFATGAALGTLGVGALGARSALTELDTPEIAVRLARLPKALDGFRIVQLSDVHVGPLIGPRFLRHVVAETNRLRPDLIVITGDLVDGSVAELRGSVDLLTQLRSRHGTYFVTGNHEYYSGWRQRANTQKRFWPPRPRPPCLRVFSMRCGLLSSGVPSPTRVWQSAPSHAAASLSAGQRGIVAHVDRAGTLGGPFDLEDNTALQQHFERPPHRDAADDEQALVQHLTAACQACDSNATRLLLATSVRVVAASSPPRHVG